jgi:molybdenum cofactor cytidylyltransferase
MPRSFAIIPAAGRSARMGAPKLLLPVGGRPLIEWTLAAWSASRVTRTVVVVRPGDAELIEFCRRWSGGAIDVLVPPTPPAEMKDSVRLGRDHLAAGYAPAADDALLLAPADMPGISLETIEFVLHEYEATRPQAVVPTFRGKRGHPIALPWSCAAQIDELAADEGINALVARQRVRELSWHGSQVVEDVDTPEDLARLAGSPQTKQ